MTSYRFDIGNSAEGGVGMVARVTAQTPQEALEALQEALGADTFEVTVPFDVPDYVGDLQEADDVHASIEYVTVYVAPQNLTVEDIDEDDFEDDDSEDDGIDDGGDGDDDSEAEGGPEGLTPPAAVE